MQQVIQVILVQQLEDLEEAVKVIQDLRLQVQNVEQQETLHQQLLLKEMLVETEFVLVVLEQLKLPLAEVVLEQLEQMLFNQVPQILMLALVE